MIVCACSVCETEVDKRDMERRLIVTTQSKKILIAYLKKVFFYHFLFLLISKIIS